MAYASRPGRRLGAARLAEVASAERCGDWALAEALLAAACAAAPSPFWQIRRGEMLYRRGRPAEGLEIAAAVLRGRPGHAGALALRGACLLGLRRWADAEQALAAAWAGGGRPYAAVLLARARRRTAGAEAAIATVRQARARHPSDPRLARAEAELLGRAGRPEEAGGAWQAVLDSGTGGGGAAAAGWLEARLSELPAAQAADEMRRLLTLARFREEPRVHALLARTLERAGREGEAAAAWRAVRAAAGGRDAGLAAQAVYGLRRCGAREEAQGALRNMVRADPRDARALAALVFDARALGRQGEARRLLLALVREDAGRRHLWGWMRRLAEPPAPPR